MREELKTRLAGIVLSIIGFSAFFRGGIVLGLSLGLISGCLIGGGRFCWELFLELITFEAYWVYEIFFRPTGRALANIIRLIGIVFVVVFWPALAGFRLMRFILRFLISPSVNAHSLWQGAEKSLAQSPLRMLTILKVFSWVCSKETRTDIDCIVADLKKTMRVMQDAEHSNISTSLCILWEVTAGAIVPIIWGACQRFIFKGFEGVIRSALGTNRVAPVKDFQPLAIWKYTAEYFDEVGRTSSAKSVPPRLLTWRIPSGFDLIPGGLTGSPNQRAMTYPLMKSRRIRFRCLRAYETEH